MASKRRRSESSRSARAYDHDKFVNDEAAERYRHVMEKKSFVLERGLQPHPQLDGDMAYMIAERNWGRLATQPEPAVIPVVKEFYANAIAQEDRVVQVRGKAVSYDSSVINAYFGLRDHVGPRYYADNACDLDETIQRLCKPGTVWTLRKDSDEKVSFHHSALSKYGAAWYAFICANLMPTRHKTEVTKERALLLHGIVRQEHNFIYGVDVGLIIQGSIDKFLTGSTTASIPHASLITALCREAGVQWRSSEPLQHPMSAIDHLTIEKFKPVPGVISHPRGEGFIMEPPQPDAPGPENAAGTSSQVPDLSGIDRVCKMMLGMNRRVDRLAQRQNEMYTYMGSFNTALANAFAHANPGADMGNFPEQPSLSAYPPSDEDD